MKCLTPMTLRQVGQDLTIRCGQCHPCRIKRREEMAARILLESYTSSGSWFITCTYAPTKSMYICDEGKDPVPTLWKDDRTRFLKRLRKRLSPQRIRYFSVGEYGLRMGRQHWHFVLFGLPQDPTADIDASWGHGFITCAELTPQRARYAARYTTKKLTGPMSFDDGRSPELVSMSRRPGLGRKAALMIGQQLIRAGLGQREIPTTWMLGGRQIILDRYVRSVIASELGNEAARKEIALYRSHLSSPDVRASCPKNGQALSQELKIADESSDKARSAF